MKIYIIIFFDFIFYFLLIDLEILNKIGINKELEIATVYSYFTVFKPSLLYFYIEKRNIFRNYIYRVLILLLSIPIFYYFTSLPDGLIYRTFIYSIFFFPFMFICVRFIKLSKQYIFTKICLTFLYEFIMFYFILFRFFE